MADGQWATVASLGQRSRSRAGGDTLHVTQQLVATTAPPVRALRHVYETCVQTRVQKYEPGICTAECVVQRRFAIDMFV